MVFDSEYTVLIDFSVFHCTQKIKRMTLEHPQRPLYMGMLHVIFFPSSWYWFTKYHSLTLLKFMSSKFPQVRTFGSCDIVTDYVSFLPLNLNITKRVEIKNMRVFIKTCKSVLINIFKNVTVAKRPGTEIGIVLLEFYFFGFISCKIRLFLWVCRYS